MQIMHHQYNVREPDSDHVFTITSEIYTFIGFCSVKLASFFFFFPLPTKFPGQTGLPAQLCRWREPLAAIFDQL